MTRWTMRSTDVSSSGCAGTRMMKTPSLAEKLQAQVLNAVLDNPEQFAVSLKKERNGWAAFIKRNGIVLEK